MSDLMNIQNLVKEEMQQRFSLKPVSLKHPFPERPVRSLKLMKIDGEVFESDKIMRLVFIRPKLPVYFAVRSMFIRPKVELDLPVFAGEVMRTGNKRLVIIDIHRTGKTDHDDSAIFSRMMDIQKKYPEFEAHKTVQKGEVQNVFSPACFQVKIPSELDDRASSVFMDYLGLFLDILDQTEPATGDRLEKTQAAFREYLDSLIEHDTGVKVWKMLFGEKGGVERSLDMHFGL